MLPGWTCKACALRPNPSGRWYALELASRGSVAGGTGRQEVLDEQARLAYTERMRSLRSDIDNAEAAGDVEGAERLHSELRLVMRELEVAAGFGGRQRSFNDQAERARTSVRKAIKRAVDTIDDSAPVIADLLRASITTGTTCHYTPHPRDPVHWYASRKV